LKNSLRIAGSVLFAITSVACQGASGALTAPNAPSSLKSTAATASLQGVTWRLVEMGGRKAIDGVTVTAVFAAPNSLSGSGGCNRYFGAATANDGKLTVSPLGSTRMYCAEAGVSEQEDAYFSILAKVTGYTVVGAELRLHTPSADAALVFVRE
jgi:heat shock protein HslJ